MAPMDRPRPLAATLALCIACTGCALQAARSDGEGDPGSDGGFAGPSLVPGSSARVTASSLNLRNGIGTGATVEGAMPCGTRVSLLGGPSTTPTAGWWNLRWDAAGGALTGWASGSYLIADSAFTASMCGGTSDGGGAVVADGGGLPGPGDIFGRAKLAVGYSYYWGHGSWREDGAQPGSCSGSCPSCTHAGQYGADCSGFIAKAWQVPSASALDSDGHPFSTASFYSDQVYWKQVPRSTLQPADALVRRDASSGHIALYESGADPFGAVWLYEARGCATGVVHDLRTVDSSYLAIRRN